VLVRIDPRLASFSELRRSVGLGCDDIHTAEQKMLRFPRVTAATPLESAKVVPLRRPFAAFAA